MDGTILGKKYNLMNGNGGGASSANIAPTFSETSQYIYGDLVFYEGQLYRFEVEEHEPGPWNSEEVMGTSIDENLVMLPGDGIKRTMHEFSVKLKSDGGLHFDQNGAIYADHLPDYRLIEHKTGQQWIDGKDVYQTVIDLETPVSINANAWQSLGPLSAETMIEVAGINSDDYYFPFGGGVTSGSLEVLNMRNQLLTMKTFIVKYTKPTQTSKKKTSK